MVTRKDVFIHDNNYLKFNISNTLGLKNMNHLHKILLIEYFVTISKMCIDILKTLFLILLDFNENIVQYSITFAP
jgi:hypothetical protein